MTLTAPCRQKILFITFEGLIEQPAGACLGLDKSSSDFGAWLQVVLHGATVAGWGLVWSALSLSLLMVDFCFQSCSEHVLCQPGLGVRFAYH